MNNDVCLSFTPKGLAVYTLVCYSLLPCNDYGDSLWTFDSEEEDMHVVWLLNPWEMEDDLLFDEIRDLQ